MAPLPKRKHSTARKGRRRQGKIARLLRLVVCRNCGKKKLPHRVCKYCKK
ncbi:50S ribosomal protein L32 [Patescibacteria group bacterium]|nr:50S ribosomal protein L32 [Patescibacteria group bacterium]MCL5091873.1 50S ribosomal protein L32 [Patescibacteria group bacterium]